jgi:aldose 1-epimerase
MITRLPPEPLRGRAAALFELASPEGFTARVSAGGARLVAFCYPDGTDVVVGPVKAEDFAGPDTFAGCTCGRVANRISDASFMLDGERHHLSANHGAHQLHGGDDGFHNRIWDASADGDAVRFTLASPDGDQGYPGALSVSCTFALNGSTLSCAMEATTDRPTIINLTNHAYWNLAGSGPIADHTLQVEAERYCVAEAALVTGEVRACAGTPYDFREGRRLGAALDALDDGIDNNFCLRGARGTLRPAGSLAHGPTGRSMAVSTTECGLQIYTANHFGDGSRGKNGGNPRRFHAIAMEPQAWPDAPNREGFPSIVLRPGEVYAHRIEWRFA